MRDTACTSAKATAKRTAHSDSTLAGDNISARFVVPTVATSVDLVVHLGLGADGVRRVNEVVSVPGRVEADVIEVEPLFVRHGPELRRTGGVPARVERYERVGIDVHQVLASDGVAS